MEHVDAAKAYREDKYLPEKRRDAVSLCLSGGGFRAALFHLGALTRLNELGVLAHVNTISSVSGGSIVGAVLANYVAGDPPHPWPSLHEVIPSPVWNHFIVDPIEQFTSHDQRTGPLLRRVRPWNWFQPSAAVLGLRDHYYRGITTLSRSDLPDHPRFIFCATEITHGVDFIFEKDRAGSNERKRFDDGAGGRDVARAVAASSCFPPVFQPLPLRLQPQSPLLALGGAVGSERTAQNPGRLEVSDGGVYDNLGIEPIWRNSRVILVSDGGAPFRTAPDHGFLWRLQRWADIGGHAAGSLRKRWLISNYITGGLTGTYWGIDSAAGNYPDGQSGYSPSLVDQRIAAIRTDLDAFSDVEAQAVQNHGYSLADAAVRSHVPELITLDCGFTWPYPERSPEHSPALWTALRRSNKRGLLGHEPLSRLPAKLFDG